jgi:hypothetical protein
VPSIIIDENWAESESKVNVPLLVKLPAMVIEAVFSIVKLFPELTEIFCA